MKTTTTGKHWTMAETSTVHNGQPLNVMVAICSADALTDRMRDTVDHSINLVIGALMTPEKEEE
jgi:hypothetical protein